MHPYCTAQPQPKVGHGWCIQTDLVIEPHLWSLSSPHAGSCTLLEVGKTPPCSSTIQPTLPTHRLPESNRFDLPSSGHESASRSYRKHGTSTSIIVTHLTGIKNISRAAIAGLCWKFAHHMYGVCSAHKTVHSRDRSKRTS